MDDLRGVGLRGDGMTDSSHFLRVYGGLRPRVFWQGLCLNGGVGPSNLGVHLEIDHRRGYRWWGRAAILHGQEC